MVYEVTATNCAHWLKLRVAARDQYAAAAKFQAYLDRNNPKWSVEECGEWNRLGADEEAKVADYVYDFKSEKIERVAEPSDAIGVRVVGSGGNG